MARHELMGDREDGDGTAVPELEQARERLEEIDDEVGTGIADQPGEPPDAGAIGRELTERAPQGGRDGDRAVVAQHEPGARQRDNGKREAPGEVGGERAGAVAAGDDRDDVMPQP